MLPPKTPTITTRGGHVHCKDYTCDCVNKHKTFDIPANPLYGVSCIFLAVYSKPLCCRRHPSNTCICKLYMYYVRQLTSLWINFLWVFCVATKQPDRHLNKRTIYSKGNMRRLWSWVFTLREGVYRYFILLFFCFKLRGSGLSAQPFKFIIIMVNLRYTLHNQQKAYCITMLWMILE